jgi:hypothetical protein
MIYMPPDAGQDQERDWVNLRRTNWKWQAQKTRDTNLSSWIGQTKEQLGMVDIYWNNIPFSIHPEWVRRYEVGMEAFWMWPL